MKIEDLQSKLNLLKASFNQYRQSGHFSEEEILKLQEPIQKQIEKTQSAIDTIKAADITTNHEEL